MGTHRVSELSPTYASLAHSHAVDIASLPEPPETFLWRETDVPESLLYTLLTKGIIEKVVDRRRSNSNEYASRFRIDGRIHEFATQLAGNRDTLPCCNSTGIVNDGGTIRCKRCGEQQDRETVREVLA